MKFQLGVIALVVGLSPVSAQAATVVSSKLPSSVPTKVQLTAKATKNVAAVSKTKIASASIGKAKKRTAHHDSRYHYGTYFVPPPPAFMPSILPELSARANSVISQQERPEGPYKKYIYERTGESPEPMQSRKGVVTWGVRNY